MIFVRRGQESKNFSEWLHKIVRREKPIFFPDCDGAVSKLRAHNPDDGIDTRLVHALRINLSFSDLRHPTMVSATGSPGRAAAAATKMFLLMLLLHASVLFRTLPMVSAFPGGAGGCSGQQGSVGGFHLSPPTDINQIESTDLASKGLIATYDTPDETDTQAFALGRGTTTIIEAGTLYTVYLTPDQDAAVNASEFLGFLFRLAGPDGMDTSDALSVAPVAADTSQEAAVCTRDGIGGITHTSNVPKERTGALLQVDVPGTYDLQVTAVFRNGADADGVWVSDWAFNSYNLQFAVASSTNATATVAPTQIIVEPTSPPVGNATAEISCSICPEGTIITNFSNVVPGLGSCGEIELETIENPVTSGVCDNLEELEAYFALQDFCGCSPAEESGNLTSTCSLCAAGGELDEGAQLFDAASGKFTTCGGYARYISYITDPGVCEGTISSDDIETCCGVSLEAGNATVPSPAPASNASVPVEEDAPQNTTSPTMAPSCMICSEDETMANADQLVPAFVDSFK